MSQQWDECIEVMGDDRLKSQKPLIVATVHQLLLQIKLKFNENLALLDKVVGLIKKIFCIERSVVFEQGQSKELE
jgi:hypothetical protein